MSDIIKAALDAPPTPSGTGPLSEQVRARRSLIHNAVTQVLDAAVSEKRGLLASEERSLNLAKAHMSSLDVRIDELLEQEKRQAASNETYAMQGPGWSTSPVSGVYHRGAESPSFFRDLRNAQLGDAGAIDRLRRNNEEVGLQTRALGNTGGVGGSGGEFAPPGFLVEEFVRLARPGRVTADLLHHEDLPPGVSSVNLPRVVTGTTTAIQSTQNTALSQTDLTTAALSANVVTIGGKQVVSQQLLDQSPIAFDRVILEDLAADYARQIGQQVLTGSGTGGNLRGVLTPASTNVVTWTQAAPTAGGFYAQLAKLQGQVYATRYAAPDSVVMHPRRWAWLASYTDSTGRPLVVPASGGFNAMATPADGLASGMVGEVLGMKVYTDASIPTTLGAGTNQDVVLMLKADDIWLWESPFRAETFTAPYADSAGVLFRVLAYSAMIPDRYLASLGQITGTGLITPTFAS